MLIEIEKVGGTIVLLVLQYSVPYLVDFSRHLVKESNSSSMGEEKRTAL